MRTARPAARALAMITALSAAAAAAGGGLTTGGGGGPEEALAAAGSTDATTSVVAAAVRCRPTGETAAETTATCGGRGPIKQGNRSNSASL
jgi:hypothetical protein